MSIRRSADSVAPRQSVVSCKAFEPLILTADLKNIPQPLLLEDLPFDLHHIQDPSKEVAFHHFATYIRRLESHLGGPEQLDEIGRAQANAPSYAFVARFAGLMADPRWIYKVAHRWFGPSLFPDVRSELRELPDDRLEMVLTLPPNAIECPQFFRMTASLFRHAPVIIGAQPAAVELRIEEGCGTFLIAPPPSATLWARLGRSLRAFFSGASVLEELSSQHDRIRQSYQQLEAAHERLIRSEESFRTLIESSPDGIIVFDENNKVLYTNTAFVKFLGFETDNSIIGRDVSVYLAPSETMRSGEYPPADDDDVPPQEVIFEKANGDSAIAEVKTLELVYDGSPANVAVIRDITERKELMARVMEMDRMIAVGTLAAGVAHEINNPMAYVQSNVEFSRQQLAALKEKHEAGEADIDAVWKTIDVIDEALDDSMAGTTRVRDIVQDLKTFSRRAVCESESTELQSVIESSVNMAWSEIHHRARLKQQFSDLPPVRGNESKLGQVFLNLVVNAAQAIESGSPAENEIRIETRLDGDVAVVEIADTGEGIAEEAIDRIFDPFFTTKPPGEGTGLGLSICRNIVRQIGGSLRLQSEPGVGTRCIVRLPLADSTPSLEEDSAVAELTALSDVTDAERSVLVVDDDPRIGKMMSRILSSKFSVEIVQNGATALERIEEGRDYSLIVCDAMMPGVNGYEVYNRLCAEHPSIKNRFVLMTGGVVGPEESDQLEGYDHPILHKPFGIDELQDMIRERVRAISGSDPE